MMEAREYLEQIGKLQAQANLKMVQLQSLRASLTIGSSPMDTERVSCTRDPDVMAGRVAAVVDMEHELDEMIDRLVDKKREIIVLMEQLDTEEALYLTERYLELKNVHTIAEEHEIDVRSVRRHIHAGLEHLQRALDLKAV